MEQLEWALLMSSLSEVDGIHVGDASHASGETRLFYEIG